MHGFAFTPLPVTPFGRSDAKAGREYVELLGMADCTERLERWVVMIERVRKEITDLLWQRETIRRVGRMIDENPELQASPKPFLWEVRRWYMYFAAMAVRRQTDRTPNNVSLGQLLLEIQDDAQCITRDLLDKQFEAVYGELPDSTTKELMRAQLVDEDWKKRWAAAHGSFNVDMPKADLEVLESLSKELMIFASSQLAHTSLKAIGMETKLTFNDMDAAIDFIEKLTIKYCGLLTGKTSATLESTEQYDWYQQFRFAWRRPKAK